MKLQYKCKLCNDDKIYQNLGKHIEKTHINITQKEYYDTYLKKENEGYCLYCNKNTKFIKISKGYNLYCNRECFYKSDLVKKHREETVFNKTGKINVFQVEEIKERIKKTNLENIGVEHPLQSEVIRQNCENTCNQIYGCKNPFQNENVKKKCRETMVKHWGCEYNMQSKEIRSKAQTKYNYFGIKFDSAAELIYYIYCKDHNINIIRNTTYLTYYSNNKIHRYFPDFKIDGVYYEIKGNHMITEDFSAFLDPHTHKTNQQLIDKMNCLKENNVKIILTKQLKEETEYIIIKYGKDYIKKFKNNNKENNNEKL